MKSDERAAYFNIPIHHLQAGQYQPRKSFDQQSLATLANTLKEQGLIQPIVVRPLKLPATLSNKKYEIIAGERRWRAAQLAKFDEVPCLVKNYSDEQAAKIALIENMHREDLNPIEEARAVLNIINETSCTHEEAAISLSISREEVTHLLRLLKLEEHVQKMLIDGELSKSQGRILAGISKNLQYQLAVKCVKNQWSKRALEDAVREITKIKTTPKKDTDIAYLERNLSDHLGTPVILSEKGYIKIKYDNLDIMEGILQKIGYKETI